MTQATASATWIRGTWKVVAAVVSTTAAVASVTNVLISNGYFGESRPTVANFGARWIGIAPKADTARSIGDTIHLAATVTDRNGSVLAGARPTWESEDSSVARVLSDGSVIARQPGSTAIIARVREVNARARIVVRPAVSRVVIAGDSGLTVPETEERALTARGLDARGHIVPGRRVEWRTADTSIVTIDSVGLLTARQPGRTIVSATIDTIRSHVLVTVAAVPAAVELVSGASQRATAGTPLARPIAIQVLSRGGRPIEGVMVRFRAEGHGTADPPAEVTDAEGRVRATWTLGTMPGPQTLVATVDRVDSTITVTAEADPDPANTRVSSLRAPASDVVATPLAAPLALRVTDSTGRPLVQVPVSWVALDGGSIEPLAARTDSLGDARARWTLGPKAGPQRARAFVGHSKIVGPIPFSTRARPGSVARLTVTGSGQRGSVGQALSKPLVIRALDAQDNPVPNATITIAPSEGTVPDRSLETDSTGRVTVKWTLGQGAGEQVLTAKHSSKKVEPLEITANASPGAPVTVKLSVSKPATAKTAARLAAVVTDAYGNPIARKRVLFTAKGGTVSPTRPLTDARGRVEVIWKRAAKATARSVTARVDGTKVSAAISGL